MRAARFFFFFFKPSNHSPACWVSIGSHVKVNVKIALAQKQSQPPSDANAVDKSCVVSPSANFIHVGKITKHAFRCLLYRQSQGELSDS